MRRRTLVLGLTMLLVPAGCATTQTGSGGGEETSDAVRAAISSRQSPAEAERTLASLRRVDDLPLYEMTYLGAYDAQVGLDRPTPSPVGCSLFAAVGDPSRPLFARNFDWDPNPALVLRTDPPEGYASISLVDISYLGVGADPTGDRRLLDAVLLPFDGMNERGLAVGLAADDNARADPVPGRPRVGSVRILRLVLDEAATVAEAIRVFQRYNLDFEGGPPLHYLLADATGASAVVEFVDGRMRVQPGTGSWQALTNVPVVDVPEDRRRADRRYGLLAEALTQVDGVVDTPSALELLDRVRQGHTRWSVVYELRTGEVRVRTAAGGAHQYRLTLR